MPVKRGRNDDDASITVSSSVSSNSNSSNCKSARTNAADRPSSSSSAHVHHYHPHLHLPSSSSSASSSSASSASSSSSASSVVGELSNFSQILVEDPSVLMGENGHMYDVQGLGSLPHGEEGAFGILRSGIRRKDGLKVVVKEILQNKNKAGLFKMERRHRILRLKTGREMASLEHPRILHQGSKMYSKGDKFSREHVWLCRGAENADADIVGAYRDAQDPAHPLKEMTAQMCIAVWGLDVDDTIEVSKHSSCCSIYDDTNFAITTTTTTTTTTNNENKENNGNTMNAVSECSNNSCSSSCSSSGSGKSVNILPMPSNYRSFLQSRQTMMTEVVALKSIPCHPNLVPLLDFCQVIEGNYLRIFMVMPYAVMGDLMDYVAEHKPDALEARILFTQIVRAVEAIHAAGWAHRDIKLDNCLLSEKNPANGNLPTVWLGDFGLATKDSVANGQVGSVFIKAPEICGDSQQSYDPKQADLWSLGIILFNLLAHTDVWWMSDDSDEAIVMREASRKDAGFTIFAENRHRYPDMIDPMAQSLIESLLKIDPSQRMSIQNIWQHPWMMNAV